MSFCRFGPNSDVYCYYHVGGFYDVWAQGGEHHFQTAQEVIHFLEELRAQGEKVPDYAVEQLRARGLRDMNQAAEQNGEKL